LREVTAEDLPTFFAHQQDPVALQMAALPSRDGPAFMTHWARILEDAAVRVRTILADGRVAGNVVCFDQDGERQVGYRVGREFWGRGVATRALTAFLGQVPACPLYARVAKGNPGSVPVLEKRGIAVCGGATGEDGVEE
ncbi:MAG TPA: GNAT family N-acetyltransferase, partial [Chloroflexia bacterium]|nr:GNAT family N-acetyltransferase [Chloroflexia bacterium]